METIFGLAVWGMVIIFAIWIGSFLLQLLLGLVYLAFALVVFAGSGLWKALKKLHETK